MPSISPSPAAPNPAIDLADARRRLIVHPLYSRIDSAAALRRFMEFHVYAVWDFQSLLKAMQRSLTCTSLPWLPTADREARRLVNEIVLDEESDELPEGGHASHFELYLESMQAAGADTGPVEGLLAAIAAGRPLDEALDSSDVPPAAAEFIRRSFAVIASDSAHRITAAFTFGREDVIPDMFRQLVSQLADQNPDTWGRFRFYLERHIAHDDACHAPACRRIIGRMCGNDTAKWAEASATARECLEARIALWDAIAAEIGEPT
jgi:pyrroloquinoline quinone (PQQ) biosynthesis protein C